MAYHATVHTAASSRLSERASRNQNSRDQNSREPVQGFMADALAGFVNEAWLLIENKDFLGLQQAASHLSSCARALGHGFIGEVAAMVAVSAIEQEADRCRLFLAVIQREWDTGVADA